MTKLVKLTPVLLAIFPAVFLYDQNKNEISFQVVFWPTLALFLVSILVFFITRFFEKTLARAVLMSSLCVIGLLYYGFLYDLTYNFELFGLVFGRHKYLLPFWLILLGVGLYWLKTTKKDLTNLVQAFCFSALVMVAISSFNSVYYNLTNLDLNDDRRHKGVNYNIQDSEKLNLSQPLPDIYYIVPDAYAGFKILNKYFDFDNKEFYENLKKRGFVIAQNSKSNYQNTYFSLASTLNMEYINYLGDALGKESKDYNPVRQMINDNRTIKQLNSAGYKYLHFDSDYTTFLGEDPLAIETPTDIFVRILMKSTILRPFGGRYGFKESAINNQLGNNVLKVFDSLEKSTLEEGPKFVFAHITSPHGPYVFDRDGQKVNRQINNNIEEMGYYLDQLIFVNKKLTALVDKILSNSKTPPIIIIQSDHGFYVPPEILKNSDYGLVKFNVRMANLSAYYLPKRCISGLPQSISTVNTFRLVFDKCFGTRYGLLENKSYYFLDEKRPYDLMELDYSKDPF